MPPFNTVFFDLDGTLIDHFDAIHRAHCYTRRYWGLSEPTMDDVHRAVGAGVEVAVERIFAHDRPDLLNEAIAVYRAYWDENMLDGVRLLAGARELLVALKEKGIQCAVLTNKHGPSSRKVCSFLGIADLLAGVFGAKDSPWLKPQKEFVAFALGGLGKTAATLAHTCLIGDSIYDVQTGVNTGFPCYCVTTGTHDREALVSAGARGVYENLFTLGRDVFGLNLANREQTARTASK